MTTTSAPPSTRPDVHVALQRVPREEVSRARALVARDGAVVTTGWPVDPETCVLAAATLLGTRLRRVERVRERTTQDAAALEPHRDGAHVTVDVHGVGTALRLPEPDHVQVLCSSPAPSGGASYVVDGYRLLDRVRAEDPALHAFLVGTDVDIASGQSVHPSYRRPQVCRLVEWTRGGRVVVRTAHGALPVPRDPDAARTQAHLDAWAALVSEVAAQDHADLLLQRGDLLLLDNYRCLHGVRAHTGPRTTVVGRSESVDAWDCPA